MDRHDGVAQVSATTSSIDVHGIEVEVCGDREGIDLNHAVVTDHKEAMEWLCEGATDGQLSEMASIIVREQIAREQAQQERDDVAVAEQHLGG